MKFFMTIAKIFHNLSEVNYVDLSSKLVNADTGAAGPETVLLGAESDGWDIV